MSGVNAGKRSPVVRLQKYLREPPTRPPLGRRPGRHGQRDRHHVRHLADGAGLAPGSPSYQAGNPGYSGSEQARPAFAVLAVVAATAAMIALACRAGAGTSGAT